MKARKDAMYSFFFLLCFFTFTLNGSLNLQHYGISLFLTDITNQEGITLATPKGTHIHINEHKHVKIPISQQPIILKGSVKGKPPFTKETIQRLDDQQIISHFFHTNDPSVDILPHKTVPFGFRYPALPIVIPWTIKPAGHIDLMLYKPHNSVKVTVDVHGKGHLTISQAGPWIALFKHTHTDHPLRVLTVKAVLDKDGKLIHSLEHKHHVADMQMVDDLIKHKVMMADIDYKKKTVALITNMDQVSPAH